MEGHEDTSTTLSSRAFTTEALDLSVGLDLIILQDRHLDLLTLVLDLLGSLIPGRVSSHFVNLGNKSAHIVSLLLPLLGATTKTKD